MNVADRENDSSIDAPIPVPAPFPRRVLMLCYYFPPLVTSGVARSVAFANHLHARGWKPVVLTVSRARDRWLRGHAPVVLEYPVVRSAEWNLHGLVDLLHGAMSRVAGLFGHDLQRNYFYEYLCIPDAQIAWFSTAKGLALARQADVIYVSCSPFSSATSGCWLQILTGKPLVLDFRDMWVSDPAARPPRLRGWIQRRLEAAAIARCSRLIVNTPGSARVYSRVYPDARDRIRVIPNGYDKLNLARPEDRPEGRFVIMHVGSFYGNRQPDLLLEALAELRLPNSEFVQLGGAFPSYERFRDRVPIEIRPPVAREEVLRQMRGASVLYLKQWWRPGADQNTAIAAKTYEYLATGLPVLAELPEGDNAQMIQRYGVKAEVVGSLDKEEMKAALLRLYEARERFPPAVKPEFIRDFERQALADRFLEVLAEAASERRA